MWYYEAGHYSKSTGEPVVDYFDVCGTEDGAIYAAGCAETQIASEGHWGNHWSDWRKIKEGE